MNLRVGHGKGNQYHIQVFLGRNHFNPLSYNVGVQSGWQKKDRLCFRMMMMHMRGRHFVSILGPVSGAVVRGLQRREAVCLLLRSL